MTKIIMSILEYIIYMLETFKYYIMNEFIFSNYNNYVPTYCVPNITNNNKLKTRISIYFFF